MISNVIAAYHPVALLRRLVYALSVPDVDIRVNIRHIIWHLSRDSDVLYLDLIDAELLGHCEPDYAVAIAMVQVAYR